MGKCLHIGASNLIWQGRESLGGSSTADFSNNVRISHREKRESNYFLRIIKRTVSEIIEAELAYLMILTGYI